MCTPEGGESAIIPRVMLDARVIDLSTDVAGAFGAKLLAAVGADVVKVEPPGGDPTRRMVPRAGDTHDHGVLFAYLNTGKRSIEVDTDDEAQRERLLALLDGADVVIESGAPGEWAARGVDLDAVRARHPRMVVCSVTPFGQDGPRAGWRATALTAAAAGGQMALCGESDEPPLKTAGHQASYQAGLHVFASTLTTLFGARRGGPGDHIDLSIQEVQAASLEGFGPGSMVRGSDSERTGNQARAIWGIYPCADGFVGVAAMARQTGSIFECIGHPELAGDPRYTNLLVNPDGNEVVAALITEWTTSRTAREIFDASQEHRAPFSLIPTPSDLLEWEPLVEAGFWRELDHPVLGRHTVPGLPFELDGDGGDIRPAPLLGEHTDEVLRELDGASDGPDRTAPVGTPAPLFDGLRVLDLTQVWAGPYATRFLADMGADVVHIEGPTFADAVRGLGRGDDPRSFNKSAYFNEYNRNKRGLSLDLQRPEGVEAFRRMVREADVVIENWSVGVAERLGVGYEELRAINPRIVMVQMPGFGQTGAEAERVGFGPTIEQMGGLVALQGYEGGPPHKSGISYGDPTGGIMAAAVTALALLRREESGEGGHAVVRQRDNIIGLIGEYMLAESIGRPLPVRIGNRHPDHAPHNAYRTRDDGDRWQLDMLGNPLQEFTETWLAVAVESDEDWAALRTVMGDPRLDDPGYATIEGRRAAENAIDAAIGEWARDRASDEAAAELQAGGVSASPVLTPLMLTRDEHLNARGFYTTYDHPEAGEQSTTRPVWRLASRPFEGVGPAPCFGEHNVPVLRDLAGYDDEQIAALVEARVVTDAPSA
jgi:crotonobetainyl-CoA:carnitine CoA-transferase CaiB-like acyl-CoA transferase